MQRRLRQPLETGCAVTLLVLVLLGCGATYRPIDDDEYCTEVAFSYSNLIFNCTGDDEEANQGYRDFAKRYACVAHEAKDDEERSVSLGCAINMRQLSCEELERWGDDVDQLLHSADETCADIIVHEDGTPLDPIQEEPDA